MSNATLITTNVKYILMEPFWVNKIISLRKSFTEV